MIESQFHSGQVVSHYRMLEKLAVGEGGSLGQTVPFSTLTHRRDGNVIRNRLAEKSAIRTNDQRKWAGRTSTGRPSVCRVSSVIGLD